MKLTTQMMVVLTGVGILSGGILAGVGILTKDRIAANRQKEIEEAILLVVPGSHTSQNVYAEKDYTVFEAQAEDGSISGYAVYAVGTGFQDKIGLMVGCDPELVKIRRLTVLQQAETPGLGAKITDTNSFLIFWENKDCTRPLGLEKPPKPAGQLGPDRVNAITGATISSQAVLDIVNKGIEKARSLRSGGRFAAGK